MSATTNKTKYGNGMHALFAKYKHAAPAKKFTQQSAQALLDFDIPARVFVFGSETIIVLSNPSNSEAHYVESYLQRRMA